MSGGVDSSVAAAMLKEQDYQVVGGFIKNWSDTKDLATGECSWRSERRDAIRAAAVLGIPLLTFDFEKQYKDLVVKALYDGYAAGRTPNPDVLCNEYVKFGLFWEKAKKLGFDLMATGHYAKVWKDKEGRAHLLRGKDTDKDQSYFLYRINYDALAHSLFPIGGLKKSQVRALAKKHGLSVAEKPDSQGICFIGKIDFKQFLALKIKPKSGDIVDRQGNVLGRHDGLHNYTIGQRQSIKIAGAHPWYVAAKDLVDNKLVVVESEDDPLLHPSHLGLADVHWLNKPRTSSVEVQVRYRQDPVKTTLSDDGESLSFAKGIKAPAEGQSAVIYKGDECLGGGIIHQISNL